MATDELMTLDQIKESVALLRLRRASIPEMREYKPQAKGKAKKAAEPERDIMDTFGSLFKDPEPTSPELPG